MIPIGDETSGRLRTPYVTFTLIALNILVFLYEIMLPDTRANPALTSFIYQWGAVPAFISDGQQLHGLFTSMFLHGGWMHLIGNMVFLFVFGDNVEDAMGHPRFLAFYLLCGLGAGMAQVLINPQSQIPLVGASGAISGVLGAYIVLFPHGRVRTLVFLGIFATVMLFPAWVMIGVWILLQVINGVLSLNVTAADSGGVAFWAHIGGFALGAVLVFIFRDPAAVARQRTLRQGNQAWSRVRLR